MVINDTQYTPIPLATHPSPAKNSSGKDDLHIFGAFSGVACRYKDFFVLKPVLRIPNHFAGLDLHKKDYSDAHQWLT